MDINDKAKQIAKQLDTEQKIMISEGIFSIDDTDIAILRGGGVFEVVKEYRAIEHDGQRAEYTKGMIVLDRATPKLSMNTLSILPDVNFSKMYANTEASKSGNVTTITGTFDIKESDFHTVKFKGFMTDGTPVQIKVENAINLENINWALVEKNEVVHALNYVGTPEPGSKNQPWELKIGNIE